MEFTNIEKEWLQDIKKYACDDEVERILLVEFPPYMIETYNHTMDNYSIDTSFGMVLHKLRKEGYMFLGTGKAPWQHNGRDMAVIFEDTSTYDKYWYHTTSFIIEVWQEQARLFQKMGE